jgi:hypothetical protein
MIVQAIVFLLNLPVFLLNTQLSSNLFTSSEGRIRGFAVDLTHPLKKETLV